MAEGRQRAAGGMRDARRWSERFREALAEVEEQRDDAIVYLSAIKSVVDMLARGHGTRDSGQAIAEALVQQLAVETCVIAVRHGGAMALVGFATRGERLVASAPELDETGWLTLAGLVGPKTPATCFRRMPDGSFVASLAGDLGTEGFLVLPFAVSDKAGGALVLHSLVEPAQAFARGRALTLVAEIVGQALTVAGSRDAVQRLCRDLEAELGITRRRLSAQQDSLRTQEENIQALTRDLIRSNRVKRDFLGTVSHELRTPLNAILGYTSLVRDGLVGEVTAEQTSLLDRVLDNTRNLNALIDDMLFFVQVEADRVLVRPEPVAMRGIIDEVVSALPERTSKTAVGLVIEVALEAATLRVDPGLLRRILFHLVGNALKFTERGEVRVQVAPDDDEGGAVIAVRDTGVGIAPERMQELFELFSQGDGSTTRRYSGLGMGLTLVQRCVHLLGGEISMEGGPGGGSEFVVRLPGVLGAAAAAEAAADMPSRAVH